MPPVYDELGEVTERMFDAVLNLNLKGPFRLSVLAGERMAAAGGGSIVNISSTGSIRPRALQRIGPARRDRRRRAVSDL